MSYNTLSLLDFYKSIFGRNFCSLILNNSKGCEISLKIPEELINAIDNEKVPSKSSPVTKELLSDKVCSKCEHIYSIQQQKPFLERNMMFPGWLGKINPLEQHKKDIMILGESVTSSLPNIGQIGPKDENGNPIGLSNNRHLSIGWDLGLMILEETDILETKDKSHNKGYHYSKFWHTMKILFSEKNNWLKDLYISDLGFCNCNNKLSRYLLCSSLFLRNHIELINPKLIITLGNVVNNFILGFLQGNGYNFKNIKLFIKLDDLIPKKTTKTDINGKEKEKKPITRAYFSDPTSIRAGEFVNQIHPEQKFLYLNIPHTAKSSAFYTITRDNIKIWQKIQLELVHHESFRNYFKN